MKLRPSSSAIRGLNLIEMLVVITIIAILAGLVTAGLGKVKDIAEGAKNLSNLKQLAGITLTWSTDHSNKLPSPIYPGGMKPPSGVQADEYFPQYYKLGESGEWLDGVVFASVYMQENKDGEVSQIQVTEDGSHLKGTIFENTMSVKKNPEEKNWHRHSYAMNANLQYDRIYDQVASEDPYLTEKTLSNLVFAPRAMLYIDCAEPNVVKFEDRQTIIDTMKKRWGEKGRGLVGFLDGHAERMSQQEIPSGAPQSDRDSSRFWRGVDPK